MVLIHFADQTVRAVPYDMPVIGYRGVTINTLRLWQSEPVNSFDFGLFNDQKYDAALKERNLSLIHISLNVVTAASGTYEQTLKSEIAKADAPVLFQINGPKGYASWKDYCKDLKDTEIYQHLTDKNLAITSGDGVYGIPYVVEGYGIIYNDAILQKYFNLPDKGTSFTSMDEIRNFDSLKELVEDMTAKKEELGIEGVFASTSMTPGDDWRWQTHLANIRCV